MGKFALLIGVSEYSEGEDPLSDLPAALNDVRRLAEVLEDPNIGEFDQVRSLENPSGGQMRSEIEALFADRNADDLVLLYFSGHGITDQQGQFFFSTPKTHKTKKGLLVKSSAVPAQEVHGYMNDCASDRMVVILDCCHSGAFGDLISRDAGEIKFEPQLGDRGRVVLTASAAIDYSYERSGEELAVYTRYLIEGMRSGAADRDEDGYVSANELHDYVVEKLEKAAPGMSPQRYVKQDGEKIHLTKAIVADPTRRYRKAVKRYSQDGVIRPAGRRNLEIERQKLGLSREEAEAITADELRPYREYARHKAEYEDCFREELEFAGGVLDDRSRGELNDLIRQRSLKPDDVKAIEQRVMQELNTPDSTATNPNFVDYYQLFSIQPEWDIDKIRIDLLNLLSGTKARINAASGEQRKQIDLTLKRITEAREILTDSDKKAEYDAQRAEWLRTASLKPDDVKEIEQRVMKELNTPDSTATSPNFVDYYQLFSLQPEWDIDKIRIDLLNCLSGTKARVNTASGEKRKQIDLTLKRITEARKILTDPDKKAEYDTQRAEWLRTATPASTRNDRVIRSRWINRT